MESLKVLENRQFEGREVEIITLDRELLFELYSAGMALGYSTSNGYAYKDRIDKIVKNAEIKLISQGVKTYLTEDMLYDFMLESRTEKCKKFRKWVTSEVLPDIRKNGMYATENTIETMLSDPETAIIMLQKYKEEKDERKKLELENAKQSLAIVELDKKASLVDNFLAKDSLYTIDNVSKILGIKNLGRNNFYKYLRSENILQNDTYIDYRGNEKSGIKHFTAFAKYTNTQQYFVHRTREFKISGGTIQQDYAMFTTKGVNWIYKRLQKDGYISTKSLDEIMLELDNAQVA